MFSSLHGVRHFQRMWSVADLVQVLDSGRASAGVSGWYFHYQPLPQESHAMIFHPAALAAFRAVLSQAREGKAQRLPAPVPAATSKHLANDVCELTAQVEEPRPCLI
jgi:hypothetical protein